MTAFYNENDPHAAAWLRELIAGGHIAPGVVDERDIQQLKGVDLGSFTQVHLFAGIGGWSLALRLAGWPDDRPIWTGSCPCQPFSAAGKQKGAKDARHLWPWMRHLIFCWRPPVATGEQVASALGREWLTGVRANLETLGYAVGAADLCAAGVAAPNIRQRLFWMADAGCELHARTGQGRRLETREWRESLIDAEQDCGVRGVAKSSGSRFAARAESGPVYQRHQSRRGGTGNGGDADISRSQGRHIGGDGANERIARQAGLGGFWSDFDIIPCRDNKARRVEPGSFPLADGVPARVVRLRGYGNAINPHIAAAFIAAYLETRAECAA